MPLCYNNSCPLLQGDTNKKASALFTGGKGKKKMIGKVQWNEEGLKYYKHAERKYRELYKSKLMDIIYRGWEQWLLSVSDHSIDGSNSKTFHSIMGTWTRNGKEDDCSKGGGLTYASDYEENGDDEKGYFSDTGTGTDIVRWANQPPHPSTDQSSPDKSVDTGVAKMEDSSPTSHNSTAEEEESDMGLDDVAADGKRKKSATGRRRKREDTTLTNSPAKHTRAQMSKLKGSRLF